MNVNDALKLDIDDLPVDVFEVADLGLTPRSLTGGHGMPEHGASVFSCNIPFVCSCSCVPFTETEDPEIS